VIGQRSHHRLGSVTWGIEQGRLVSLRQYFIGKSLRQVSVQKVRVRERIYPSVALCLQDHFVAPLDACNERTGTRQRKRKVTDPTVQVQHLFARLDGQPVQSLVDHRLIDISIDLREVTRRKLKLQLLIG